jgi:hypothetical protein
MSEKWVDLSHAVVAPSRPGEIIEFVIVDGSTPKYTDDLAGTDRRSGEQTHALDR